MSTDEHEAFIRAVNRGLLDRPSEKLESEYAHPWIADAVEVLKYLYSQPQDPGVWEKIDTLLSAVPAKARDLGFGSPADKRAALSATVPIRGKTVSAIDLLRRIKSDLVQRAGDDDVVDLSQGIWLDLCDYCSAADNCKK